MEQNSIPRRIHRSYSDGTGRKWSDQVFNFCFIHSETQLSVTTSMSPSSPSLLLDVKFSSSSMSSAFSLELATLVGIVVPRVVCRHFIRRF
jgi:hypothetical protein